MTEQGKLHALAIVVCEWDQTPGACKCAGRPYEYWCRSPVGVAKVLLDRFNLEPRADAEIAGRNK